MATTYECKVITDTVDLNGKKKYTFTIEEPADLFFYRSDMKLTCIKLDSCGSLSASKPGRITGESLPTRDSKGKKIKISYEPDDAKTMPGLYRLEVIFKHNGRNGPKECTKTTEYRVVDSTPIAVTMNNVPIMKEQSLYVPLQHSLSTKGGIYETIFPSKFSITGPRNSRVEIKMNWNGYSHGHKHHLASYNKLATGQFSGFTQRNDHWIPGVDLVNEKGLVDYRNITFTTKGMSGKITVRVLFKDAKGEIIDQIPFYLSVRYKGLKKLEAGAEDNIKLVGDKTIHPDNHYGTQKLIDAIKAIAKAYGEAHDRGEFNDKNGKKPPYKKLYVNDMSLKWGGRYDCAHKDNGTVATQPFKGPHEEHMFGEEVDIQTKEMNSKQEAWFDKNKEKSDYGFSRGYDEGNHFHCSVVKED
jgi:hypothetical protein